MGSEGGCLGVSGQVWDYLMGVFRGVSNNKFRQLISNFVIILLMMFFHVL